MGKSARTKVLITCFCGNIVTTSPSRLGRKKYCSKRCFYQFRTRPSGLSYEIKVENKGWFSFKGGAIDKKGYRKLNGRREHRVVLEKYLCRKLFPNEIVHHINGNKLDNNLNNLQVVSKTSHDKFHWGKHRTGVIYG